MRARTRVVQICRRLYHSTLSDKVSTQVSVNCKISSNMLDVLEKVECLKQRLKVNTVCTAGFEIKWQQLIGRS